MTWRQVGCSDPGEWRSAMEAERDDGELKPTAAAPLLCDVEPDPYDHRAHAAWRYGMQPEEMVDDE